ncbi:MAG: hypothetical protein ACO1SV_27505 [Fimbriimonas sp.]
MIGTIVSSLGTIEVSTFSVLAGAHGIVEAEVAGRDLLRVRFDGAPHSVIVYRDDVGFGGARHPVVLVIGRQCAAGIYDVFRADRTGLVTWTDQAVSAEAAADSAVEQNGEYGYPVFWNGEPYLAAPTPLTPEVPA